MNIMLSNMIFNWIGSDLYEQVIEGEYKEFYFFMDMFNGNRRFRFKKI